jgi:pimeloyl-ACP methyl ester carboxylesterase
MDSRRTSASAMTAVGTGTGIRDSCASATSPFEPSAATPLCAARRINVPTLLVRGSQSDIVSREEVAELLELIPSAQAVEVVAGHMVAGDDNDIFSRHLLGFLAAPAISLISPPGQ